jgi:predicted nucleic-acid-binding Zn-ribbon protein
MKNGRCPKCGSTEIMADVTVRDVGDSGPYPLRVEVEEPEPAQHGLLWTPKNAAGDIRAWICSQCGYTELYTHNLEELHTIYKLGH